MKQQQDILKKLFTDDSEVNPEELFKILSPFIRINKKSKEVVFLDEAHKQSVKNRIILFLLAKKVLFLLGETETDRVQPKVIIKESGMPRGTVLPTLKSLRDNKGGSFISSEDGTYYISSYQISKIKEKNIFKQNEENK
jgi:hypothetical protein